MKKIGLTSQNHCRSQFQATGPPCTYLFTDQESMIKVPCLRAQGGFEPTFTDCESTALATALTRRYHALIHNHFMIGQIIIVDFVGVLSKNSLHFDFHFRTPDPWY